MGGCENVDYVLPEVRHGQNDVDTLLLLLVTSHHIRMVSTSSEEWEGEVWNVFGGEFADLMFFARFSSSSGRWAPAVRGGQIAHRRQDASRTLKYEIRINCKVCELDLTFGARTATFRKNTMQVSPSIS
jgi:hypothetical protein